MATARRGIRREIINNREDRLTTGCIEALKWRKLLLPKLEKSFDQQPHPGKIDYASVQRSGHSNGMFVTSNRVIAGLNDMV